jgi:hypothetical protein
LKYMINISYHVIFHIIPFISPRSYIIPWAYLLSCWYHDLGLIKGVIWKMPCNNLYIHVCLNIDACIKFNYVFISWELHTACDY